MYTVYLFDASNNQVDEFEVSGDWDDAVSIAKTHLREGWSYEIM